MSLISLKNFAGPLRSKLQMGALAIVIILVLVLRIGTSRTSDGERTPARSINNAADAGSNELLKVLDEAQGPAKSRPSARPKDALLEGLVEEGLDSDVQEKRAEPEAKNEAFEDIRKSLGLE